MVSVHPVSRVNVWLYLTTFRPVLLLLALLHAHVQHTKPTREILLEVFSYSVKMTESEFILFSSVILNAKR